MLNMLNKYLLGMLTVLLASFAQADQRPDDLNLVGEAKLKIMMWDIYQCRLYTPTGRFEESTSEYMLEITYLRNIKNTHLVEQTHKQWQHLGIPDSQSEPYIEQLRALWPDVIEGDTLTMHVTATSTTFFYNGAPTGEITEPSFGPMFVSIWLSPETSQPKLRKKLLGGA
jgi:hypothetical protein